MKTYEVNITGNGTLDEIAYALLQVAESLEPNSLLNLDSAHFKDIALVTKVIDMNVQVLSPCCKAPVIPSDTENDYCSKCNKEVKLD